MADFVYGLKIEADAGEVPAAAQQAGAALDQVAAKAKAMADKVIPANDAMARGFKLNQVGMMEMRAAGVNAFQALAAGMDPLRVAMMEGAQVMGALVQGGVRLGAVFGALTSPIGLAIAAVGALGAAYFLLRDKTEVATVSEEEYQKAIRQSNELLDTAAQHRRRLAEEKLKETTQTLENTVAMERNTIAILRNNLSAEARAQAGMMIGPGAELTFGPMEKQLAEAEKRLTEAQQRLTALANPPKDSALANALFGGESADKAGSAQKAIQEQIRALQEEAVAQQLSARERAIHVELLKAEATARKGGTAVTIDQVAAITQLAGANYDFSSSQAAQNALVQEAASVFARTRTPVENYAAGLNKLNLLMARGLINQETFDRGVEQMNRNLIQTSPLLSAATNSLSSLGVSMVNLAFEGGSVWDVLKAGVMDFEKAIIDATVRMLIMQAVMSAVGGAMGGGGGASLAFGQAVASWFHTGGIVGRDSVPTGYVHPAYFENAQRFHEGGEVPAVLKKGEGVFTPRQMENADKLIEAMARGGGSDVMVNIIDQRSGDVQPAQVSERRGPGGGRSIDVLIADTVDKNLSSGRHDRTLATNFGVGRRPGR
jgi:hypothetical protein